MGSRRFRFSPWQHARDLPIGVKLAATVLGALSMLAGIAWFALDRMTFVTTLQADVAAQSAVEHQVQRALLAAAELRVVSRELQLQQTAAGVKSQLTRAATQTEQAASLLDDGGAGSDATLRDDALSRLSDLMIAVRKAADLRGAMIVARQKRLFQARPVFDSSLTTLTDELERGEALSGGVASVRDNTAPDASARQGDPVLEAVSRYRLAMSRVQNAALMFMATGNGVAANDIRDATGTAEAAMTDILNGPAPDAVKADARLTATIGKGIMQASADMIAMTRQLDQVAGTDVEAASEAMQTAFEALTDAVEARQRQASATAAAACDTAYRQMLIAIGLIAALMIVTGTIVTRVIAGPIGRLTRTVQAIASGETRQSVPYTAWRDEIGRMAASVEALRTVMHQTFIQSQMIEQLPVGVMTAERSGDFRITYLNTEARTIMDSVQDAIGVPADKLIGCSIDRFHKDPTQQRAMVSDPANLPHSVRLRLGAETVDLRISAIYDRHGTYAGPLLTWRRMTGQARLVEQFDVSVGAIARIVGDSADAMKQAATVMRHSAVEAGQRTLAVASASDVASQNVNTAAAGAEQVAVSVAEISRQVAESARIAARAVSDAEATDASVSGLARAADRINAVVRLISDIAGRTNLLALNATIEAARAGEAGKGFAVVAGEVKNLATQTAKATEEIGGQIAAMQQATGAAVGALRSIGETIQRMNEIATTIAGSVEQQGAATQSIAQAVQQAAAGTAEVNGNIAAVTQAVDETGERAGGVLEAATAMTEQAAMLKVEAGKFLLAVQQAA